MSLSATALARSVPNGFSMITRERSTNLASASIWITAAVRHRRDAQVVQPARLAADLVLRLAHGVGQRLADRPWWTRR